MEYRMSRRTLLAGSAAAAGNSLLGARAASAPTASWRGAFLLPERAEPVALSLTAAGQLSLGAGHVASVTVPVRRSAGRVRFAVPGRPAPLVFDGVLRGGVLAGRVRQGSVQGTFRLR